MQDYLTFFSKWLDHQFVHDDEELHKRYILKIVSEKYIIDEDEASYWSKRDCWSMYHLASKDLQKKLWNLA
jgi:hypothetical protein